MYKDLFALIWKIVGSYTRDFTVLLYVIHRFLQNFTLLAYILVLAFKLCFTDVVQVSIWRHIITPSRPYLAFQQHTFCYRVQL